MNLEIGRKRIYNTAFEDVSDVIHWEVLNIKQEQELYIEFISTNSKYRQGIRLAVDVGEGYIEINGLQSKEMCLWEDTAPQRVHVKCKSEEGLISVYNIFDIGRGQGGQRAQADSCGMLVERIGNVIMYRCNDAGFKSDFDKLIFRIELI